MKFLYEKKEYSVTWKHAKSEEEICSFLPANFEESGASMPSAITVCNVYHQKELVTQAFAYCSSKDVFNKEVGRKVSLAHAIKDLGFGRQMRTIIWKAYFER